MKLIHSYIAFVCCAGPAKASQVTLTVDSTGHSMPAKVAKEHRKIPGKSDARLCESIFKYLDERRCRNKDISVLHEQDAKMVPLSKWPLTGCNLHKPSQRSVRANSQCTVAFAASSGNAEHIWARLPSGGLVVVPLRKSEGSSFMRSEFGSVDEDPEGLIWQAMYQINSKLGYWPETFGENLKLGLPDLQFATFLPGYALFQKADHAHDIHNANGTFWKLADAAGTDKIDKAHNYSLLYHRHFDESGVLNEIGSMMLEIGLGCMLEPGNAAIAGASAKIWPRLFPTAAVHFIEVDRLCTARWQPHMREAGVAKVHIGPQADKNILAEVVHDASFAKPGGFGAVVDDGSHIPADIEKSFRTLLPHLRSGGLYFIEDMMYASWGAGYPVYQTYKLPRMKITSKNDRSSATPVALTAVLAAGVTGLADVPDWRPQSLEEDEEEESVRPPDRSFFGPITDQLDVIKARLRKKYVKPVVDYFSSMQPGYIPPTRPVRSYDHPEEWRKEVLAAAGALIDFIECSPGICVFRRA